MLGCCCAFSKVYRVVLVCFCVRTNVAVLGCSGRLLGYCYTFLKVFRVDFNMLLCWGVLDGCLGIAIVTKAHHFDKLHDLRYQRCEMLHDNV